MTSPTIASSRPTALFVLLPALLLPVAVAHAAGPPADEAVQVRRDHLPVLFEPSGRKSVCDPAQLVPANLRLTVDRKPLRVTAVGPKPQPRIHALLVDISESMLPRLAETRKAAIEFLDSLPEEDAVIVASFDESLVLHAPLGSTREEQRRAVGGMGIGYATALWDGLFHLALYLESLRGDKVIVVLTDGEDSHSLDALGMELFARIDRMPAVTVFPIGIDLPRLVRGGLAMARGRLGELARVTGGQFFETRDAKGLRPVFDQIRERVEGRLFVSFVPPAQSPGRKARTRLEVDRATGCKSVILGSARIRGRDEAATPPPPRVPEGPLAGAPAPPPCPSAIPEPFSGAGYAVALPRHLAAADGEVSSFRVAPDGTVIGGWVNDIAVERGPLFRAGSSRARRPRMTLDRPSRFAMRRVAMTPPSLDRLQQRIHSPADVLLHLLEEGLCDTSALPAAERSRPEQQVHGLIFLHLRRALAHALFDGREDYRDWAVRGAERLVEASLEELELLDPGVAALPPEARSSLRAGIRERLLDPGEGALPSLLAAWLGDVDSAAVLLQLELDVLERALSGEGWNPVERVIEGWPALWGLLPPATGARVVALLAPAYDPERDVVGFYRFILPRPRRFGALTGLVPRLPLALLAVDWAATDPDALDELKALHVVAIRYGAVARSKLKRGSCPRADGDAERPMYQVELRLVDRSAPQQGPQAGVRWVAYFHTDERAPSCMEIETEPGAGEVLARRGERLRSLLGSRTLLLD